MTNKYNAEFMDVLDRNLNLNNLKSNDRLFVIIYLLDSK